MSEVPLIKRFLQHQSQFMAYLMAITGNFDDSEEIFQNAAVVMMEQSEKGDTIRDFFPWAKEVVRRQALYFLRQQVNKEKKLKQIEPELVQQISNAFLNDESTQQIRDQELAALRQCIREADPEQQLVLNMRYSTKSSFAEIAERIGKTEGAVQRAMSRLRKRLHDCVHSKLLAAQG